MDCEKFEPLLLDELYDELDELTSAGVKRHVSGCARCASLLAGMKATRRLAVLETVDVPEGLEERIFAAAREAQKVVPIRSPMSRFISAAGKWAMRPQTAMAAMFLLMIGSSAVLIRSNHRASRDASVSVTVAGEPAPMAAASAAPESLDNKAAAAAHGTAAVVMTPPPAAPAVAQADDGAGPVDRLTGGAGRGLAGAGTRAEGALAASDSLDLGGEERKKEAKGAAKTAESESYPGAIANAAAPAGAPMPAPAATTAPDPYSQQAPANAQPPRRSTSEDQSPYNLGLAAYRARNYAEATRQFDVAAQSGDLNSALWAAKSTKEGSGCAVALGRFEQVAQKGAGAFLGHQASLEAAKCQIAMGQYDTARERLAKLTQVPAVAHEAQAELKNMDEVAARKKAAGTPGGGGAAARPAAPAPMKRAAPADAFSNSK